MLSLDGATKQEVNQSPLAFVETPIQANVEQALARKDAIIRVRNAQVHARQVKVAIRSDEILRLTCCQHPHAPRKCTVAPWKCTVAVLARRPVCGQIF